MAVVRTRRRLILFSSNLFLFYVQELSYPNKHRCFGQEYAVTVDCYYFGFIGHMELSSSSVADVTQGIENVVRLKDICFVF